MTMDTLVSLLSARSFASLWYWLLLSLVWTLATRQVLGVPIAALRQPQDVEKWLPLTLKGRIAAPGEWAGLVGVGAFLLSALATLGFGFRFEAAQALSFMLVPPGILAIWRQRLARQMATLLLQNPPDYAGISKRLWRHHIAALIFAGGCVMVTAFWGAIWRALHPYGI